jgi:hypothetical protein
MEQSSSAGERSTKRVTVEGVGVGNGRILLLRKSILLFFARAGLTVYLFFFINNRV